MKVFRFVAFCWDKASEESTQNAVKYARRVVLLAPEWRRVFSASGLCVFCADLRKGSSEVHRLAPNAGVVLGTVFPRSADDQLVQRNGGGGIQEDTSIFLSHGRALMNHYWGRYVAFIFDAASGSTWVLRDPTGYLPCFHTRSEGVEVYFSFVEDCVAMRLREFSINWKFIRAQTVSNCIESWHTGLNEVTAVLAGECVEHSAQKVSRSAYWDPSSFSIAEPMEHPELAAKTMRAVTRSCVQSWASCYEGILHRLSGGLDSAIVLGALDHHPPMERITCLNYYFDDPRGDERKFARLAAHRFDCELIEWRSRTDLKLDTISAINRSTSPENYINSLEIDLVEPAVAREKRATALFGGGFGDQTFYQGPCFPALADFITDRGLCNELFPTAINIARMQQTSIWTALRRAARLLVSANTWDPLANVYSTRNFVSSDIIAAVKRQYDYHHPWLRSARLLTPGRRAQVYAFSFPARFYRPMHSPGDPEPVEPLMSQPLMELCLRIPTYVLLNHGRDRALARKAFVNEVPSEILERRTKGQIGDHLGAILNANRQFAREFLMEGVLIREKILDRKKIEDYFSGRFTRVPYSAGELLEHLSCEAWSRKWLGTPRYDATAEAI